MSTIIIIIIHEYFSVKNGTPLGVWNIVHYNGTPLGVWNIVHVSIAVENNAEVWGV
jgi:hypothetical protein